MARVFTFDARYLRLVESYIANAIYDIAHDKKARLLGKRIPIVPDRFMDSEREGNLIMVALPEGVGTDVAVTERNARIVAFLARPDVSVLTSERSATGKYAMRVGDAIPVVANSLLACVEALLAMESGTVSEMDLDGREAGDHMHAMGA